MTAHALVFVASPEDKPAYREALLMLGRVALNRKLAPPEVLSGWESAQWIYESVDGELRQEAAAAVAELPVDWALTPVEGRRKKLLIADMDSTIINVECLDELADFAGIKAEIAAITERAMRGELDFEPALRERVGKLKGLALDALQKTYDQRVRLNPGAATFVRTMSAHGARCVLVSGGFTFFTSRVADAAGFQANRANVLMDDGTALTGVVQEPILGRKAKLDAMRAEGAALRLNDKDVLAIGDGANDLDMIKAAGLGIAYRAKPLVAAEADAKIDYTSLEAALFFQGYRRGEFVQ
ncbi:phosphoserine phosphatase SerB [Candidatus Viadribacter manganicus]|uniref:Phosphoserine phosphatase n=1 Tax=Candidatus Viadribacter manganicus TaxID=1759059 RepID=A0A1B1AL10_9PROT|nr:phosphoserine phosphatase SerB [Candidatus Viadribacter manganicus]ANP47268.1 phosphoserine phosphatase [Candidatus Viadribacter manganicus]